jgi:Zn-dependent M16 (insulinase) family peptidase
MGEFEPYLSEPSKAAVSTSRYLSGYEAERRKKLRSEILSVDKEALIKVADVFEELSKRNMVFLLKCFRINKRSHFIKICKVYSIEP